MFKCLVQSKLDRGNVNGKPSGSSSFRARFICLINIAAVSALVLSAEAYFWFNLFEFWSYNRSTSCQLIFRWFLWILEWFNAANIYTNKHQEVEKKNILVNLISSISSKTLCVCLSVSLWSKLQLKLFTSEPEFIAEFKWWHNVIILFHIQ